MDSMSCKEELPRPLKSLAFDVKDSNGNNLLHRFVLNSCATENSERYVNGVLRSVCGVSSVNDTNSEGFTSLHLAVRAYNCLMVSKLLSCFPTIDVNFKSLFGRKTALHMAAELCPGEEDVDAIVKCLIRSGADLNARDCIGNSPLATSVEIMNLKTVKVFIECGGSFLNSQNIDGDTPLHVAAREGCFEIAKALMEAGAAVDISNIDCDTPLHFAVKRGCLRIVKALIEHNADVRIRNKYLETPLHVAARGGCLEVVSALMEARAYVDFRNKYWDTPLHLAAKGGYSKIIFTFIKAGANVNIRNENGDTPLDIAAKVGCFESVKALKVAAANVDRYKG